MILFWRGRSYFFRLRLCSCSKILESGSGIFLIWESDSCLDSGYHGSNLNFPMLLHKEMTTQTPVTTEIERWLQIWVRFFTNFWLGSERKTQNPAGVDSAAPDPWLPLILLSSWFSSYFHSIWNPELHDPAILSDLI